MLNMIVMKDRDKVVMNMNLVKLVRIEKDDVMGSHEDI